MRQPAAVYEYRKYITILRNGMKFKRYFIIFSLFLPVIIFLVSPNSLLLAASVRNYGINPLNRVTIYFDKLPESINETQSDDKKTLTIDVGNISISNVAPSTTGSGIIQSVSLQQSSSITTITLSLSEPRGYNISRLPWSQALLIEVFD